MVDSRNDAGTVVSGEFGVDAFSDINAAITAADAGDTVQVLAGDYSGTVVVDESITLEGANADVAAGVNAGTRGPESTLTGAIIVQADDVAIRGFEIVDGADIGGDVAGIFLAAGASETTIENNILTGAGTGRGILSSFNGENDNLVIRENDISGWTSGIFNQTNDNVDVLSNVIHDNVAGVANDFVSDVLIRGNDFFDNAEAVGVFESTDVRVNLNNLADNEVAVNNYGGPEVDARFNFFGTTDPDEIDDLISGDVDVSQPLDDEVTGATRVYTDGDVTLIVDTETGEYELTLADGTVYSGTGARVQNGKLKIHDQSSNGKVDVKGQADGTLEVNIRGRNKQSFELESAL
jgi:hypothetical protein